MSDLPVVGAQLSVLDLDRHRDWLFEKDRDLELPEFCMADILNNAEPFIDMAKSKLDGWDGRLGIHGPFSGFELHTRDKEVRAVVQTRLEQALNVCEQLGAVQMVIHSPYDPWDRDNLDNGPKDREKRVSAILDTLGPALTRAEDLGVEMVMENIKDTDPGDRMAVIEAADSAALRLSVDTGHAHWAHTICGAPPADRFISHAGAMLGHVHLQDTDGYADRHWPLGCGNITWHGVFEAIKRTKANPHLIVEINDFDRVEESVKHLEALGLAQ
ncbi:sugar phosphate isomerase/epimerase [Shimia sp. CNT1-13L.2]|uniref:sugar phosphate isomerase/epimerase family protein n=1 Tax=Shimia sp. CNT1-13L.2 TaxID=2959663 RepID=UPI0020CFA641|nr:sugar phosphate isomerase/epimerase family protein [Shimia sp. CNT1-13L.2]MCP9480339.1 sugar phosphate isomerase/epimerase [Shimia sp. CNT1-13L.2]